MKYSKIEQSAWDKMPSHLRRQENALSKFERKTTRDSKFGFIIESRFETSYIASDYTQNALDDFDPRPIAFSNENVCRNFVLACKPSKRLGLKLQTMYEIEYLESLELFNLCANCQLPIETQKMILEPDPRPIQKRITKRGKVIRSKPNHLEVEFADIPEHFEVYWHEKADRIQYYKVEARRVYNVRCECFRRIERGKIAKLPTRKPIL